MGQFPKKMTDETRVGRNGQVALVAVQRVLGASERVGIIVASRGRYEVVGRDKWGGRRGQDRMTVGTNGQDDDTVILVLGSVRERRGGQMQMRLPGGATGICRY